MRPSRELFEISPPSLANSSIARLFQAKCYRRDRRKDQLLQENGYLVLRYLAEDLAKELDSVLDGILRSLSSRRKLGPTAIPITVVQWSRA